MRLLQQRCPQCHSQPLATRTAPSFISTTGAGAVPKSQIKRNWWLAGTMQHKIGQILLCTYPERPCRIFKRYDWPLSRRLMNNYKCSRMRCCSHTCFVIVIVNLLSSLPFENFTCNASITVIVASRKIAGSEFFLLALHQPQSILPALSPLKYGAGGIPKGSRCAEHRRRQIQYDIVKPHPMCHCPQHVLPPPLSLRHTLTLERYHF